MSQYSSTQSLKVKQRIKQKNESNINHKRSHMFFIGSYSEQNAVTYALRVDRRKCQYLTPKEQSYGGVSYRNIIP
jgi:hypothetical protein